MAKIEKWLWEHWHHVTYETMKPLTPRNLWNYKTINTKKQIKRNHEKNYNKKTKKPRKHLNQETKKKTKPQKPQNHETN